MAHLLVLVAVDSELARGVIDSRLPTHLNADAGECLQLAFVVAGEADHKMGQPGVGVSGKPVRNGDVVERKWTHDADDPLASE
jgi:hypothetical protein